MKKISAALIIGLFLFMGKGFGQTNSSVIEPDYLTITYSKTTNLVFPYAITDVDRGSKDILVQKPKKTENILKLKAGRKDFEETNLTVITAEGKLHSYIVNYEENPKVLTLQILAGKGEPARMCLFSNVLNPEEITQRCEHIVTERKILYGKRDKRFGMQLRLNGIFINENVLYYQITLQNNTYINYDIDQLRFFIRDQRKSKRTAFQEREIIPVHIHNETTTIEGQSEAVLVFALPKFTIPDKKYLAIQVMEKSGGRNLHLRLKNRTIVKAKLIE